jgi:hypothetical protein
MGRRLERLGPPDVALADLAGEVADVRGEPSGQRLLVGGRRRQRARVRPARHADHEEHSQAGCRNDHGPRGR